MVSVRVDFHYLQQDDEFACVVIRDTKGEIALYFEKAKSVLEFIEKINDAYIKGLEEALEERQKKTQALS